LVSIGTVIALVSGAAQAGTDNVKFPKGYADNCVLYTSVNKASKKWGEKDNHWRRRQVRNH